MSGLSSASAGLTGDLAATGTSGNLLINSSGDVGAATGTTWNSANQRLRIDGLASSATYGTLTLSKTTGSSSVLDLENDYSGKVLRVLGPPDIADRNPVMTSLDRSGKFRFGWREYGEMGWGPSTATTEADWDVGLIRGAVNQLYVTDGQSTANATGYLYALGIGTGNAGANLKIEYGYVAIRGDGELRWSSNSSSSSATKDVGVHRSAAGVLGIHDGITTTTYRDLKLRNVDATGTVAIASATATPAGGSTSVRLVFGTTAGFGVYVGSGAPTVSAAQGSLYLRSDGSSTSTRAYINSDGSTTWVAVTTAS